MAMAARAAMASKMAYQKEKERKMKKLFNANANAAGGHQGGDIDVTQFENIRAIVSNVMGLDEHGLAVEPGERPSDHSPDVDLDESHRLDALAAPDTGPVTRAEKYDDFGRRVKKHVTESDVFSSFIALLIVGVAVLTGVELQYNGTDDDVIEVVKLTTLITNIIFTFEVILKLAAEGTKWTQYFVDHDDGPMNIFDFSLVVATWVLKGIGAKAAGVTGLRMLRLVRLLRIFKVINMIKQLRVILRGLMEGLKSVGSILIILLLCNYIFALAGKVLFGENDPANMGTIPRAMLTLWIASPRAHNVMYINMYGCAEYHGQLYEEHIADVQGLEEPIAPLIQTSYGAFADYYCHTTKASGMIAAVYFSMYIVLSFLVIMSLFVGVICMGMFNAQEATKQEALDAGLEDAEELINNPASKLRELLEEVMSEYDNHRGHVGGMTIYRRLARCSKQITEHQIFNAIVYSTIMFVAVMTGIETDGISNITQAQFDFIDLGTLIIFTIELILKVVALEYQPWLFFGPNVLALKANGWNILDLLIVAEGWSSYIPGMTNVDGLVVLRMARLLRVFRAARGWPELQSIVSALFAGVGSSGWIVLLLSVFNYIAACVGVMLFRDNDPFHFGGLGRAFLTLQSMEIMGYQNMVLVNVLGCAAYPDAYPFTEINTTCENSQGMGWVAVMFFVVTKLVGGLVLTTLLVAFVIQAFTEVHDALKDETEDLKKIKIFQKRAEDAGFLWFVGKARVRKMRELFGLIDVDGMGTLDQQEANAFLKYLCTAYLQITIVEETAEDTMSALYLLVDPDGSADHSFSEFVGLLLIAKMTEAKAAVALGQTVRVDSLRNGGTNDPSDLSPLLRATPKASPHAGAQRVPKKTTPLTILKGTELDRKRLDRTDLNLEIQNGSLNGSRNNSKNGSPRTGNSSIRNSKTREDTLSAPRYVSTDSASSEPVWK